MPHGGLYRNILLSYCRVIILNFHSHLRLFIHFYVIGSSMSCAFLVILVLHCFFGSTSIPQDISEILGLHFTPSTDCFTVFLSLVLLLVQTCRRLFESLFVSVFTGKMNVAHYLLGVIYYILDATSLAAPLLQCSKRDEGKGIKVIILILQKEWELWRLPCLLNAS